MRIKKNEQENYYFSCPKCGSRRSKRYCEKCYQKERYKKKQIEKTGIPWESLCEEDKAVMRRAAIRIGCYFDNEGTLRLSNPLKEKL